MAVERHYLDYTTPIYLLYLYKWRETLAKIIGPIQAWHHSSAIPKAYFAYAGGQPRDHLHLRNSVR